MCCCDKPNVNGEEGYKWNDPSGTEGVYPVNPPALSDADVLLHDEPGRCVPGTDSHSYHYRVTKLHGSLFLLVRHGGGDESIRLSGPLTDTLAALDSTQRYLVLNAIFHAQSNASRAAHDKATQHWRYAAAQKRIKVRKQRGTDRCKVWIEPEAPKEATQQ